MTHIEIRVRGLHDSLSGTEKKVADFFLENMEDVFHLPIAKLAQLSDVSQVTWVRFCKSIGFDGLKDMKKSLFLELNSSGNNDEKNQPFEFPDIKNFSSMQQICESVRKSSLQAIEETMKLINPQELETIAAEIVDAPGIRLFGEGASGLVAQDFFYKLIRIGKNVFYDHDLHIQLTYAANLSKNDVAFFISNSGRTSELLEMLALAKERGCTCVSLTQLGKNPLAAGCKYHLYANSPETDKRSGAMSSRIAHMTVIDTLYTAIANRDYFHVESKLERSYQACLNHHKSK